MATTHSSTLAWRIPWTEEPGQLQSMGSQSQTRPSNWHTHKIEEILDDTSVQFIYSPTSAGSRTGQAAPGRQDGSPPPLHPFWKSWGLSACNSWPWANKRLSCLLAKKKDGNRNSCSLHILIRLCSKSFKLGFNTSTWTKNFQMFKLGLEKAEEPEIKLPIFIGSWKKHGRSRKTSTSASLTMLKPLTCVDHNKQWKIQDMGILDHLTCLLRNLYVGQEATVRTGYGKTEWYKIWKGVQQGCILSPCLTSMQCQVPVWMNHKLESRFLGKISITSDMQITSLMAESKEELKSLLMTVKEESEKAGLKSTFKRLHIKKLYSKMMASVPIISQQIEGEKVEAMIDFILLGSPVTADSDCSHELKDACFLEGKLWQT